MLMTLFVCTPGYYAHESTTIAELGIMVRLHLWTTKQLLKYDLFVYIVLITR